MSNSHFANFNKRIEGGRNRKTVRISPHALTRRIILSLHEGKWLQFYPLLATNAGWDQAGRLRVNGEDIAFESVTELSTRLREARISLWSVTEWPYPDAKFSYQDFLAPITSGEKVKSDNLALAVLAMQSDGDVLDTKSLAELINDCIENEVW